MRCSRGVHLGGRESGAPPDVNGKRSRGRPTKAEHKKSEAEQLVLAMSQARSQSTEAFIAIKRESTDKLVESRERLGAQKCETLKVCFAMLADAIGRRV